MPPKENLEKTCEECIHYWACSRQCGEPMAQCSATGCECYETVKSSMAYYVGTLDGAKGKIPNRLRELAEADRNHQIVILPCKVGDTVWRIKRTFETYPDKSEPYIEPDAFLLQDVFNIGKTVFLTREEADHELKRVKGW